MSTLGFFNENIKFLWAIQAVFCTRRFSVGGDPQKIEQLTRVQVSLLDRSLEKQIATDRNADD